jgi:hypothetical protein
MDKLTRASTIRHTFNAASAAYDPPALRFIPAADQLAGQYGTGLPGICS